LVSGGIIEEFGHKVETEATTQTAPSMEILGALFDDVRDEPHEVPEEPLSKKVRIQEWNTLLEEARRIKDVKHFTGPTPESEQAFTAELVFMRFLAERELWHQVGDAWVTGLLPKGSLVHFKRSDIYAFVLKTYVNTALCWPAERAAINMWRKASGCKSLVWQTIFDFEEADVVPTEYLSPIHLFKKDHRFPSAYQQRIVGGEMPGEHVQPSSRTS
jgi:hypothetical protein